MTNVPTTATNSWTEEHFDQSDCCPIVRWARWADDTADALRKLDNGDDEDRDAGTRAANMLREIAAYLDDLYDGGYDGIALIPRAGFNLTFDR